jgi:hypothetical protein
MNQDATPIAALTATAITIGSTGLRSALAGRS